MEEHDFKEFFIAYYIDHIHYTCMGATLYSLMWSVIYLCMDAVDIRMMSS